MKPFQKLFKNKQGKMFALILLIAVITVHILVGYLVATMYFQQGPQEQKAIGEVQGSLLYSYQEADNDLFIINQLAILALRNANKELGEKSLILEEKTYENSVFNSNFDSDSSFDSNINSNSGSSIGSNDVDCGSFLGVKKWFSIIQESSQKHTYIDCIPKKKDLLKVYEKEFKQQLTNNFVKQGMTPFNYEFLLSVDNGLLKIIAKTDDKIRIPIFSEIVTREDFEKAKNYYDGCTSDVDSNLANRGYCESPNKLQTTKKRNIDLIVMHYTTTSSAQKAISIFKDSSSKVSSHYLVDKNGDVFQLVKEKDVAWHAGCNDEKNQEVGGLAYCDLNYKNANTRSIGIEIVNEGWACKDNCETAKQICYQGLKKELCDLFINRKWQSYPEQQYDSVVALVADIIRRNHLTTDAIIGHEQVNPGRKQDPGPLFDLDKFKIMVKSYLNLKTQGASDSITKELEEKPLDEDDIEDKDCNLETTPNYDSKLASDVKLTKQNLELELPEAISFIRKIAKEEGLPPAIAFSLITQESKGKNYDKNSAGAYGVMQLTKIAIKDMVSNYGDELLCDPTYEAKDIKCQIRYGLRYLATRRESSKKYGGNAYCTSRMNCFSSASKCTSSCSLTNVPVRNYEGVDAKIRYYNGWSIYGWPDHDYVENVERYVNYWNKLLCLTENVQPSTIDGSKVIGEHLLKADFVVKEEEPLSFYSSIMELATNIKNNCKNSTASKDCLAKEVSSYNSKEGFNDEIKYDEACYSLFYDNYKEVFKEEEVKAPKIVEQALNKLSYLQDCKNNNQEYCTCTFEIPDRFELFLKKDSEEARLEYDISLDTDEEIFSDEIKGLKIEQDLSTTNKVIFFKPSINEMKVFDSQKDYRVEHDGKKVPIKECSSINKNHLICASKIVGGEKLTVLFSMELGTIQN